MTGVIFMLCVFLWIFVGVGSLFFCHYLESKGKDYFEMTLKEFSTYFLLGSLCGFIMPFIIIAFFIHEQIDRYSEVNIIKIKRKK